VWVPGERIAGHGAETVAGDAAATGPRVGVLALQGDVLEHIRALRDVGAAPVRVRDPGDLEGLDAIIIPGGESTAIGRLLRISGILDPLRERIASGMPALGTCAGLILLSRGLMGEGADHLLGGLDVVTRRNAFGRQVDSFETDLDVLDLDGGPLHAIFIRAPWIEEVGEGVEVLAAIEGRPVLVRQGQVIGAAFHPELTDDRRLHAALVATVAPAAG
jgi:pyridoxal 5'-phosphate synthase pdxT subunit